jgi:hypothetical protein
VNKIYLRTFKTPFELDPDLGSIGIEKVVFSGPAGYAFWTVGNSAECDILLPKTGICFGT